MKTKFALTFLTVFMLLPFNARAGQPPAISSIDSQTIEALGTLTVPFTVSDAETPAADLTVTVVSDVTSVLPSSALKVTGSGESRVLGIGPVGALGGVANITIRVTDSDGLSAERTFAVSVAAYNSPPEITGLNDVTIKENGKTEALIFFVADQESSFESLVVSGNSSNPALVPAGNMVFEGSGFLRHVTVTPVPKQIGEALIVVTVTDAGGATSNVSFKLTVIPVNQRPVISPIQDATLDLSDSTRLAIPFTVDDVETPSEQLVVTIDSSNTKLLPASAAILGGAGRNRVVRLSPVTGLAGVIILTLRVEDAEGGVTTTSFQLTVRGPAVSRRGDFNGDGVADLLFQHSTGYLAVSFMDGANLTGSSFFSPAYIGDANWRLVGSGDFSLDGRQDLLFQHPNGEVAVWFMNGLQRTGISLLDPSRSGETGWRVVSVTDFYGIGSADLLLQNDDGRVGLWLMRGTKVTGATEMIPARPSIPGWRLAGSGDFNRDHQVDLVFQHDDGTVAVWLMQGVRLQEAKLFNPAYPGLGWRIVAVGDFNRDGQSDLIFQKEDGILGIWFMNGIDLQTASLLNPPGAGPGWMVAGPK